MSLSPVPKFSLLILTLALSTSTAFLSLRKCCLPGMVFDQEERCVSLNAASSSQMMPTASSWSSHDADEVDFVRRMCVTREEGSLEGSLCNSGRERLLRLYSPQGQNRPCPRGGKKERPLLDISESGELLLKINSTSNEIMDAADIDPEMGCLEMAIDGDEIEGPFLQLCDFGGGSLDDDGEDKKGFVKKCCPVGQVIDPNKKGCVPQLEAIHGSHGMDRASWLPPRKVRNPENGAVSHSHSVKVLVGENRGIDNICGKGGKVDQESNVDRVYTDGTVSIRKPGGMSEIWEDYACVDRYVIRNPGESAEMSETTAFRCIPGNPNQNKNEETAKDDQGVDRDGKVVCSAKNEVPGSVCVPKCCRSKEVFSTKKKRCVPTESIPSLALSNYTEFSPILYAFPDKELIGENAPKMHAQSGMLEKMLHSCGGPNGVIDLLINDISVRILEDGGLMSVEMLAVWTDDFCAEDFYDETSHTLVTSAFKCRRSVADFEERGDKVMCFGPSLVTLMSRLRTAYSVCGVLSLVFLGLTLHVYRTLPALRNLHGRIVVGHVVAVFFTTLGLVILYHVTPQTQDKESSSEFTFSLPPIPCRTLGYSLYYAAVSMFCWMSSMCFDLGWTFARDRLMLPIASGSDRTKFLLYALFACLVPAALLAWLIYDDVTMPETDPSLDLSWTSARPDVGRGSCFVSLPGLIKYFYFPVSVLLVFNALAFFATVRSLWRSRQLARRAGLRRVSTKKRQAASQLGKKTNRQTISLRLSSYRFSKPPASPAISNGGGGDNAAANGDVFLHNCDGADVERDSCSPLPGRRPRAASTAATSNSSSVRGEEMALFVKIFFIMGLSFFVEVLHIGLHRDHKDMEWCSYSFEVFLRLLGIVNMLRGFFIFAIFVWKKPIRKAMIDKHPRLAKVLRMICNCMDRVLAARRRRRESGSSSDLRTDDGPRPCKPTNGGSSRSAEEMDRMIDLMMMEDDNVQPKLHRHIRIQEDAIKEVSE